MKTRIDDQLHRTIPHRAGKTHLHNLIKGYTLCSRTDGKSPKTMALATLALTTLKNCLEARGLPTDVTEIGPTELREFILHLQQVKAFEHHPYTRVRKKGLSGCAINCYLRAIRAFWSWLIREEIISKNPFDKVRIPKPPGKVVPTFSESQLRALLKVISREKATGFRDWTMILTLLDTGLRASELVGLRAEETNLEDGIVKVNGKGSKERIVPIGARVQRAIWKYLQFHRPEPLSPLCPTLFLTRDGEPITVNRLEGIIESHGRKARIEGVRCSPHTLRHTFAISYLRNGGDVFSLQRILGHSSLDIVRIYVNLAQTDIKACHRRFSPADNMNLRINRYKPKSPGI